MDQIEQGLAPRISNATKEYLPGYAELSAYMSIDPDFQIYRRFDRLSSRNLLYLQSELTELEQWFERNDREELERRETASDDEKVQIICRNQSWSAMVTLSETKSRMDDMTEEEKREATKMEKIKKLRSVTAEYQDALIRQNSCFSIGPPGGNALEVLKEWVKKKRPLMDMQDDSEDEGLPWGKEEGLVCTKQKNEPDRLSRIIRRHAGLILGWLNEEKQDYPESWRPIYKFPEKTVERLSAIISVLMAVTLLIVSIVVLSSVKKSSIKLGILAIFVFIFGLSTGLLSNCRRSELFAATATYAAVLVVFISGNFTNNN